MAIESLGPDRLGRERFKVAYRVRGREKSKTFYSRREAERFQRQVRAQRTLGQLTDPTGGRRRFGDWAQEFEDSPELVRGIVAEGADKAREVARQTLDEVRRTMHLRPD